MHLGRLHSFLCCVILAAGLTRAGGSSPQETNCDVCVYGGTASGVMAAVAAAREGCRVVIVEPSRWLGGMTGGGLCHILGFYIYPITNLRRSGPVAYKWIS